MNTLFSNSFPRRAAAAGLLEATLQPIAFSVLSVPFPGNLAQLLSALPSGLQPLAVAAQCASTRHLTIPIPSSAAFSKQPGSALGACLGTPQLSQLLSVELCGCRAYDRPHGPIVAPVTGCRYGLIGLAPHLQSLQNMRRFSVFWVHITLEAAKALAAGLAQLRALSQVHFVRCIIPEYNNAASLAARELVEKAVAHFAGLTDCHLDGCRLGDDGAEALAAALAHMPHIVVLELCDNAIGARGAQALTRQLPRLQQLQLVNLQDNDLGECDDVAALGVAFGLLTKLKAINLNFNSLSAKLVSSVVAGLSSLRSLLFLRMSGNVFGEVGASALASALPGAPSLRVLELRVCQLGPGGADMLANALPHLPLLDCLDLSCNQLGEPGFMLLGQTLDCCAHMTVLRLADNSAGDLGVATVGEAVRELAKLTELDIAGNLATQAAVDALKSAVHNECDVLTGV